MRLLVAFLLVTAVAASAAPADAARRCDRHGLEVVVANERVMVLSKRINSGEDVRYYGCRRGTRRLRVLGEEIGMDDFGAKDFRLSRNWVAWSEDLCDRHDGCAIQEVRSLNLLTGRALRLVTSGAVDWELTARGRLVVLDGGQPRPWEARSIGRARVTGTTGEHVLATGDDLDQGTLTVSGDRAYWTRGGVAESAGIP